jgi:hypothetical protein
VGGGGGKISFSGGISALHTGSLYLHICTTEIKGPNLVKGTVSPDYIYLE